MSPNPRLPSKKLISSSPSAKEASAAAGAAAPAAAEKEEVDSVMSSSYVEILGEIYEMKGMMTSFVDMDGLSGKYGTMSNEELLKEYREEES
jgi:hypothetical protein